MCNGHTGYWHVPSRNTPLSVKKICKQGPGHPNQDPTYEMNSLMPKICQIVETKHTTSCPFRRGQEVPRSPKHLRRLAKLEARDIRLSARRLAGMGWAGLGAGDVMSPIRACRQCCVAFRCGTSTRSSTSRAPRRVVVVTSGDPAVSGPHPLHHIPCTLFFSQ